MVPLTAIEACTTAARLNQSEPRVWFELGRASWLARRDADAFAFFSQAAKMNYAPAMKYLGDAYFQGRGLPSGRKQDPQLAIDFWKKAAAGGFPDGIEMVDAVKKSIAKDKEKTAAAAAAEAKEAFNPSVFQNPELMSALYYGKYDNSIVPKLLVYTHALVEEVGGGNNDSQTFVFID
jgi:TPR repeat protein